MDLHAALGPAENQLARLEQGLPALPLAVNARYTVQFISHVSPAGACNGRPRTFHDSRTENPQLKTVNWRIPCLNPRPLPFPVPLGPSSGRKKASAIFSSPCSFHFLAAA